MAIFDSSCFGLVKKGGVDLFSLSIFCSRKGTLITFLGLETNARQKESAKCTNAVLPSNPQEKPGLVS